MKSIYPISKSIVPSVIAQFLYSITLFPKIISFFALRIENFEFRCRGVKDCNVFFNNHSGNLTDISQGSSFRVDFTLKDRYSCLLNALLNDCRSTSCIERERPLRMFSFFYITHTVQHIPLS